MPSIAIPRRTMLLGAALGLSCHCCRPVAAGTTQPNCPMVHLAKANRTWSILVEAVVAAGF